MTSIDRRDFLRKSAMAGGLAFAPSLMGLISCNGDPTAPRSFPSLNQVGLGEGGYGALQPYAPLNGAISLPEGFNAVVLDTAGDIMTDGAPVPFAHDGMAAYPVSNTLVRLVRNHEVRDVPPAAAAFGNNAYDPRGPGGTTTLEVELDADGAATLKKNFASLAGTFTNCAGGQTPSGSWLSCEETVAGVLGADGKPTGWERNHGYVFDVLASANGLVAPLPLKALGRFAHEALCIEPGTGYVYQTEDGDREIGSGFYRFKPKRPGDLSDGKLEMLKLKSRPLLDARNNYEHTVEVGEVLDVSWVPIPDPDPAGDYIASDAVLQQGRRAGAAIFARLEGCWWGDDSVFINATTGGPQQPDQDPFTGAGQVWQYIPSREQLILVYESPGFATLNSPDNITVSPKKGLVLCEDGSGRNLVRGLTRAGGIFDVVRNNSNGSEWAGACFSPQGKTLFVNIQGETRPLSNPAGVKGQTLAIWGPGRRERSSKP